MIPMGERPRPPMASPAHRVPGARAPLRRLGLVRAIHIAPTRGAPLEAVPRVRALRGRGLEGDRYFDYARRLSRDPNRAVAVTLIALESLEALEREHGVALTAGESRRNIATTGVVLEDLVGRQFRLGTTILRGLLPCEPCRRLEELTRKRVIRGLVGRGGLRAAVVASGSIRVGDPLLAEPE